MKKVFTKPVPFLEYMNVNYKALKFTPKQVWDCHAALLGGGARVEVKVVSNIPHTNPEVAPIGHQPINPYL